VRNSTSRQQAAGRSAVLSGQAENWIRAFQSASPEERRGFIDAIDTQPVEPMESLGRQALDGVASEPGLTAVAGSVALRTADHEALRQLLIRGSGPDLAPILRETAAALPLNEQAQILLSVIQEAPPENAALSIALLAPGLQHIPEITDTLFDLLEDKELGAAAALTLSKYPSVEVKARIMALAETGLAGSQRARMAVSLIQNDRSRGVNP
jgi:hypothetical protein